MSPGCIDGPGMSSIPNSKSSGRDLLVPVGCCICRGAPYIICPPPNCGDWWWWAMGCSNT
jgi:hypothetical protein